ncbi:MAG: 2-C-methyl-D-erythritol 4-phosphate cytidylyltransferase [Vulcanimicrobiaceae bacterium]
MRWCAVVVAAGRGTRFGAPKQLVDLAGAPLLAWSLRCFALVAQIQGVVIVTESEWLDQVRDLCRAEVRVPACEVVPGGATRQESVRLGLSSVPSGFDAVLVHDGARPLVLAQDVRRGMEAVGAGRAAILAAPVVDTIKQVRSLQLVVAATLPRAGLWAAQTPQFALLDDLRSAHARAYDDGVQATDDAALLERLGMEVAIVAVSGENFKVTYPADIERAAVVLKARRAGVEVPS